MDPFGGASGFMGAFMTIIPIIVIGTFIFVIGKGLTTWMSNNAAPILIERARVLSKRSKVYGGGESNARTAYFVTFELEQNNERLELQVSGKESGLLIAGDIGDLSYQGSRYKDFTRRQEERN